MKVHMPIQFGISKRGSFFLKAFACLLFGFLVSACGKNPVDQYLNTPRLSTTKSTLTASKTSMLVGESLEVTLAINDQNGNLYKSTDALIIQFFTSVGSATGTFTNQINNGDGTYTATFTATAAGTPIKIRAKADSNSFDASADVAISAIPPSLSDSTVALTASTVASGGSIIATLHAVNTGGGAYTTPGLNVTFTCEGGVSTCSSSAVVDGGNGTYSAVLTGLVAGTASSVKATVAGSALTSTPPTLTVTAGAATSIAVSSGNNQTANAGSALGSSMVVVVKDAGGNTVTGAIIDWTTTSGTLGAASSTTISGGLASNTLTTATTAGTATVTAKIRGTSTTTTFTEIGAPGPATQILYTTQPVGNVAPGVALATQPVLKIVDANGNTVVTGPDSTATVTLSLSSGTGALGGTLSTPAVAGIVTFSGITASIKGSGKIMTASKASTIPSGGVGVLTKASSSFTINPALPGAFTISSAVAGDTSVVLTWAASTDATSYKVTYGTTSGTYPTTASSSATSPYTVTGLTAGTMYYFMVTATNVTGTTNATAEASAKPMSAFTISATKPTTAGAIQLSWTSSTGANSYTVKYGTATGVYGTTVSTSATSPLTIQLLNGGQNYYFMVTAINPTGTLNASAEKLGVPSALTYDFSSGTLDPSITFTRASQATRYNSSGVLENVSANVARFDYSPSALTLNGLLIEESRQNLLRNSQNFSGSLWTRTASTVQTNVAIAPDGNTTANNLRDDSTAGANHEISSVSISKSASSLPYTLSVFVKPNQYHAVNLYMRTSTIAEAVVTTCDAAGYGSITTPTLSGTGWSAASSSIDTLPNGWFRCRLTATTNTESNIAVRIRTVDNSGNSTHDGDGASGIYLWGAQLEQGATVSSYIPAPSLAQQTSQLDQSPWAVTRVRTFGSGSVVNTTAVLDPEGGNNAEFLVEDTSTNTHFIKNTLTGVSPNQTMTLSFYARKGTRDLISADLINNSTSTNLVLGNFDLTNGTYTVSTGGTGSGVSGSITSVGGGWYRCTLTGKPDTSGTNAAIRLYLRSAAGAQSYTGDNASGAYFWGVQLDAGSSAQTYREIRLGAYRAADMAVVSSLGSWYSTSQNSVQSTTRIAQTPPSGSSFVTTAFTDGTLANLMSQTLSSAGAETNSTVSSSTQTNSFVSYTPLAGLNQVTSALKANDLQTCQAGTAGSASSSAALPTVSRLYLGSDGVANFLNGWLVQLRYFPSRIPNATLCEYSQ